MNNSSRTTSNWLQQPEKGLKEVIKLLPIAVAIILANGLVFVIFYKRKSLRNSSNYLLLGLAVCDFLTGAVNIPYYLVFSFDVVPDSMHNGFAYWMTVLQTLVAVAAAYHILIITAEKYLAIIEPLEHYQVTRKVIFKVLAGIWLVSGLIATIQFAWREAQSQRLWSIIYSVTCLVIVFFIPYIFMVYAYAVMFKAVSGRKRPSSQRDVIRSQQKSNTDRKCILVFAIMASIYLCCWLPYFTIMLVINVAPHTDVAAVDKASEIFVIIRFVTSVTNPLLYTFFKRDFWLALRSLRQKKKISFVVPKRSTTLKSFSVAYTFRSRFSNSARSIDRGKVKMELRERDRMNVEYTVFISSV